MPYERPGERFYPTSATKAVDHGLPCIENGIAGVAIKQQPAPFGAALGGTPDPAKRIIVGEKFVIDCWGIVEIPNTGIAAATKGALVYITEADNVMSLTSGAGKTRFGRVFELAGERGTPTGKLRVMVHGGIGVSGAA
jgi:Uncharacterized conserved protein (DUF2190)